jgi:hypothetical protein
MSEEGYGDSLDEPSAGWASRGTTPLGQDSSRELHWIAEEPRRAYGPELRLLVGASVQRCS